MFTDISLLYHDSSSASPCSSRSSIPTTQVSIFFVLFNTICMYAQLLVLHVHRKLFSFHLSYLLCTCTSRCSCKHVHVHVNSILEDELIPTVHTYMHVRIGNCRQPCSDMYFLDTVVSREAASSNVLRFSYSPFQYMMRQLYQIPVLHTKEGILTVSSICWNVSLHYCFYLSRTFNAIIFTVLLKFL